MLDDVTAFARLQAQLRRPFADREAILRAAGIDEPALSRAETHWKERLADPDAHALRDAFRAAWRGDAPIAVAREADAPSVPVPAAPIEPDVGHDETMFPAKPPPERVVPSYLRDPVVIDRPVAAPVAASRAGSPPESPTAAIDLDATQPPVRRAGPTIPFAPPTPGVVPPAIEAQRGAARRELEPEPDGDGDQTAFLPASALRPVRAVPFDPKGDRAGAEREPWLSLAAYADFLVAFGAADDAQKLALRQRFGIASEDEQRALGAAFAARFARDPTERAAFDALLAQSRKGRDR
jgi:hypothetical protein